MEVPVAQLQRKSRWPVHPVRVPHDSILRLQWEAQEEGAIRHQHGEQDGLQREVSLGVDRLPVPPQSNVVRYVHGDNEIEARTEVAGAGRRQAPRSHQRVVEGHWR